VPRPRHAIPDDPALTEASRSAREAFATNLRELRAAAGFTQELLAERAGLGVGYVAHLERPGAENPTLTTIAWLAAALEVSPGALLERAVTPNSRRKRARAPVRRTKKSKK
jgi:transcriptional regulator with XRE-family HTH domain